MECPKCSSTDLVKSEVIYSSGTSVGDVSGSTIGINGNFALISGTIRTTTRLAQQNSPPSQTNLLKALWVIIPIGYVLNNTEHNLWKNDEKVFFIIYGIIHALTAYWMWKSYKYNIKKW